MTINYTVPAESISIEKNYEVRHWARVLSCTEDALREAVDAAGTDPEAVRRHLGKQQLWSESTVGASGQSRGLLCPSVEAR